MRAAAGGERRRCYGTQGRYDGESKSNQTSMKPALLFGGDYNVFALWSCRPGDRRRTPPGFAAVASRRIAPSGTRENGRFGGGKRGLRRDLFPSS